MNIGDRVNAWIDRGNGDLEQFVRFALACFVPAIGILYLLWGFILMFGN